MIARVWSAQATSGQAPAYVEHLKQHVLPAVRAVDGYAGAMLFEREVSGAVEIVVITLWQSLESIRRFAGEDLERAVVGDEAAALLTEFDRRARHYDVAVRDKV